MRFPCATAEGTVRFGDNETWYRVTGDTGSGRTPLVVLHGGPGSTHDYLLRLTALADRGWPVVHYDQLGNGRSTHLPRRPPNFWSVQLFLDELANLLGALAIAGDYALFGQSWGGMLAAAHAAGRPSGLRALVIANAPASMPLWRREAARLRAALPPEAQAALFRHEAAGTTGAGEYQDAVGVFYARHVCRVPWPDELTASYLEIHTDPTVYHTMNGPNEFHVTGTLRDWSVEELLPEIAVPALVLSGRHDEATPAAVRPFRDGIGDARWEVFEESSHLPHIEEPERFLDVVAGFLGEVTR
ncbi:proline iminopeptidase-family hydrolase [Actinomadura roseirufa]|uniref:proline iminopeptidase-family hydrolase n=1 Tax=Actinomadura roseirufa TaxID=2094049 RepID=UPI0010419C58|nr:proline iminopeptidase-family hydrolase [Actinomadura roseirufa]